MSTLLDNDTDRQNGVYDSDADIARRERGISAAQDGAPTDAIDMSAFEQDFAGNNGSDNGSSNGGGEDPEKKAAEGYDSAESPWKTSLDGSQPGKKQSKIKMFMKKRTTSFVAGTVLFGIILGGGAVIPTLESFHLIHYAETLKKILAPRTVQKNTKITKLYRWIRNPDDVGRTRLTILQNRNHPKLIKSLTASGITVVSDGRLGYMRAISIDPRKLPKYKGLTMEALKYRLAEDYGIPRSKITGSEGGNARALIDSVPQKIQRQIIADMVESSGKGKVGAFFMQRHLRNYYKVPTMFHPFRRLEAKLEGKINTWLINAEKKRQKVLSERREQARQKLKEFRANHGSALRTVGASLMIVGFACMVRDFSADISELNRANFIEPGAMSGNDALGMGDQIEADTDLNDLNVTAAVSNFYDSKGLSPLDAPEFKTLNGTYNYTSLNTGDTTYDDAYTSGRKLLVNGFSYDSPIKAAARFVNEKLAGEAICNPVAQAVQLAIGTALFVVSAPSGGALVIGVAKGVVAGAIIGVGMNAAAQWVAGEVPDITPHKGPLGGAQDVYGLITSSNAVNASGGGSFLSTQATTDLMYAAAQNEAREIKSQSIASRLFNPKSYSSISGKIIDGISPSSTKNLATLSSSFASIGSTLISLPSKLFSARASAADSTNYISALNTRLVGLSPTVEAIENPDKSANELAGIFKSADPITLNNYKTKTMTCTGRDIGFQTDASTGTEYLDAKYSTLPDLYSDTYATAGCADDGDKTWVMIKDFIDSVQASDELYCLDTYIKDSEACDHGGMGSNASTVAPSPAPEAGSGAIGPATLPRAQGSWGGYINGKLGGSGSEDYKKVLKPISSVGLKGCSGSISVPYLHPNAAVAVKALDDAYTKKFGYGLIFESCYRTYDQQQTAWSRYQSGGNKAARPGTSNHGWGLAIDVAMTKYGGFSSPNYKWLAENGPSFGFRTGVVSGEPWHIEYARPVSAESETSSL